MHSLIFQPIWLAFTFRLSHWVPLLLSMPTGLYSFLLLKFFPSHSQLSLPFLAFFSSSAQSSSFLFPTIESARIFNHHIRLNYPFTSKPSPALWPPSWLPQFWLSFYQSNPQHLASPSSIPLLFFFPIVPTTPAIVAEWSDYFSVLVRAHLIDCFEPLDEICWHDDHSWWAPIFASRVDLASTAIASVCCIIFQSF